MKSNKSIYINTSGCGNGILSIIAEDIVRELAKKGVECSSGPYANYTGQDIAYHMWWRGAEPYAQAKTNSVFVTHTDDRLKEHDLKTLREKFDSFVTMSEEDSIFLKELGFDSSKVFGITLPARNNYVRPLSVGMFSNCYSDNRKNEKWLLDFCINNQDSKYINYVFIGAGWASFVERLQNLGCSFEWHYVSREMPYEYIFQQLKLSNLDYYIYMGMDGGAMGTYDAYAQGVDLCVSDDGYHKDIPNTRYKFETKEEFFSQFNKIVSEQKDRICFFRQNTIENYVSNLYSVWNDLLIPKTSEMSFESSACRNYNSVKDKRRSNYFPISYQRIRQTFSNLIYICKEHKSR